MVSKQQITDRPEIWRRTSSLAEWTNDIGKVVYECYVGPEGYLGIGRRKKSLGNGMVCWNIPTVHYLRNTGFLSTVGSMVLFVTHFLAYIRCLRKHQFYWTNKIVNIRVKECKGLTVELSWQSNHYWQIIIISLVKGYTVYPTVEEPGSIVDWGEMVSQKFVTDS